ncbi:MAG: exonuclease subunit SbcD [bacterium]|nr:exonuclease subunit SbcD [Candidatus Kapabacteria bacterium]
MPRILHTADWHLGRRLEGRSRHDEQVAALDDIVRIANDENVDVVIVAGDVFDSFVPPAESEALYYRTMVRLSDGGRRAVIVIAGNHDSPDRLVASDAYARELGITIIGFPKDLPALYDGGNDRAACIASGPSMVTLRLPRAKQPLSILALPYPSESRLREVISQRIDDDVAAASDYNTRIAHFMREAAQSFHPEGVNIIASHLYVNKGIESDSERQIQVGGAYSVDASSFPIEAAYVALGHLHRPQEQRGTNDLAVRYSGSILQYSFSEAQQQKSVTIIDVDATGARHREVAITAGRTLYQWHDVANVEELERKLADADRLGWYSLSVFVDVPIEPEYVAKLRETHPGIIDLIPRYRATDAVDGDVARMSDLSLEEQFRRFVESKYGEPVSDEVMRLFLELTGRGGEDTP